MLWGGADRAKENEGGFNMKYIHVVQERTVSKKLGRGQWTQTFFTSRAKAWQCWEERVGYCEEITGSEVEYYHDKGTSLYNSLARMKHKSLGGDCYLEIMVLNHEVR